MTPVDISRPLFAMAVGGLLLAACEQAQQFTAAYESRAGSAEHSVVALKSERATCCDLPGGCAEVRALFPTPPGDRLGLRGPEHTEACNYGGGNVFIADGNALDEYSHGGT